MDNFPFNPYSKDILWEQKLQRTEKKLQEVVEMLLEIAGDDVLKAASYAYILGYNLEVIGHLGGDLLGTEEGLPEN